MIWVRNQSVQEKCREPMHTEIGHFPGFKVIAGVMNSSTSRPVGGGMQTSGDTDLFDSDIFFACGGVFRSFSATSRRLGGMKRI